jgi:hypothetical protein
VKRRSGAEEAAKSAVAIDRRRHRTFLVESPDLPEVAMFFPTLLDAAAADLFEFVVLAYFALLLGCALCFAVKVGASATSRQRGMNLRKR